MRLGRAQRRVEGLGAGKNVKFPECVLQGMLRQLANSSKTVKIRGMICLRNTGADQY